MPLCHNGDTNSIQATRETRWPKTKRKWNLIQLTQTIFQSKTYKADLKWVYVDDEPKTQEK